ncbi:hypothetical protein ABRZ83_03715 [Vibrio vulnificus]|uniref:hypothetical protein n=1 Tax=Vibrio vulnificus TaxID=672 RepID=UPI0028CF9A3F|nr:hypothetical protein [Vibrio vulnificus]
MSRPAFIFYALFVFCLFFSTSVFVDSLEITKSEYDHVLALYSEPEIRPVIDFHLSDGVITRSEYDVIRDFSISKARLVDSLEASK